MYFYAPGEKKNTVYLSSSSESELENTGGVEMDGVGSSCLFCYAPSDDNWSRFDLECYCLKPYGESEMPAHAASDKFARSGYHSDLCGSTPETSPAC